jgi:hypothetical protein
MTGCNEIAPNTFLHVGGNRCDETAYQDVCIHGVHMRSECEDCADES